MSRPVIVARVFGVFVRHGRRRQTIVLPPGPCDTAEARASPTNTGIPERKYTTEEYTRPRDERNNRRGLRIARKSAPPPLPKCAVYSIFLFRRSPRGTRRRGLKPFDAILFECVARSVQLLFPRHEYELDRFVRLDQLVAHAASDR